MFFVELMNVVVYFIYILNIIILYFIFIEYRCKKGCGVNVVCDKCIGKC